MNYQWGEIVDSGQYTNGHVDVFKTNVDERAVYAILNYLTQLGEDDQSQKVLVTLLLEGPKDEWSEGRVNNMLYDCEDRIRDVKTFKFRTIGELQYMTIQTFFLREIGGLVF